MKPRHLLLLAPFLLAAALPGQTDTTAKAADAPERFATVRLFGPLMHALDADRDRILSPDELRLAPITLTALDLDEDGFLLRDEISPDSMARARHGWLRSPGHATPRVFADTVLTAALDANRDGIVQPIEVANATSSLRRLDRNGDGTITSDELRTEMGAAAVIAQRM